MARHFLAIYGLQVDPAVRGISPDVEALLQNYDWPGNLRQLQNVIKHAVVMSSTGIVLREDLPRGLSESARAPKPRAQTFRDAINETNTEMHASQSEESETNPSVEVGE